MPGYVPPKWIVLDEEWDENPARAVGAEWFEVLRLWRICNAGQGYTVLPDSGGVNEQSAWLMDAFATLNRLEAQHRDRERRSK